MPREQRYHVARSDSQSVIQSIEETYLFPLLRMDVHFTFQLFTHLAVC